MTAGQAGGLSLTERPIGRVALVALGLVLVALIPPMVLSDYWLKVAQAVVIYSVVAAGVPASCTAGWASCRCARSRCWASAAGWPCACGTRRSCRCP